MIKKGFSMIEATFDSCRDSHIKIDLPQTIN